MAIGLNLVNVDISPAITLDDNIDSNRVLIFDQLYTSNVPFFQVTEIGFRKQLEDKGIESTTALFKAVEAFFSTISSNRRKECLVGAWSSKSSEEILTFLTAQTEKGDVFQFGAMVLTSLREDSTKFNDIKTFCNSGKRLLWVYESKIEYKNPLENEDFVIQVAHKQSETNEDENFRLLPIAAGIVHQNLSTNPNANALCVLQGSTGLRSNLFSNAQRLKAQDNKYNEYFKNQGLTEFRLGVANSGKKIEKVHMIYRYFPTEITRRLNLWRSNTEPKKGNLGDFKSVLFGILTDFENLGYLSPSPELDERSFAIDRVWTLDGETPCFNATIRISYNGNIICINIKGQEVLIAS